MLVGFPIYNIILHVFAAKNSAIKKGIGSIFDSFVKQYINGVNVNITISFDVNIVNSETIKYRIKNSFVPLFLECFIAILAQ